MNNISNKERTTSDVLLSIEQQLILLTKTIASNELTNKLLLGKLSDFLKIQHSNTTITAPIISNKIAPILSAPSNIELNNKPIITKRAILKTEEGDTEKKNITKIPVAQRVVDSKNKDVFMAEVIIKDKMTSELISKTKTNAVGKWQAYLPVGTYMIQISKTDNETKNKIETYQEVEINDQMKSLSLPNTMINK